MKKITSHWSGIVFAAGALLLALPMQGGDNNLLKLNGTFQGVHDGADTAPGWTIARGRNGAVCSKIVLDDDGTGILELKAEDDNIAAHSVLFPVTGNVLEVEYEARGLGGISSFGVGEYSIGYQGFDAEKKYILGADKMETRTLLPTFKKERFYLPLRDGMKYFRITLIASPGTTVRFRKLYVWLNTDSSQKSVPIAQAAPAAPQKSAAPVVKDIDNTQIPYLLTDYRYTTEELKPVYQIAVPLGDRIKLELEEDSHRGELWNIHSYDAKICSVRVGHDRIGIAALRRDTATISIAAQKQGSTDVVFVNPSGKKLTVRFSVR